MTTANLYECFDKGKAIGAKTAKEWEKYFGISANNVRVYAIEGHEYQRRYTFRVIEGEAKNITNVREGWAEEWDQTVARIRRACGKA